MADMISFAVQDVGSYPEGIERLEKLEAKLAEDKASDDLRTHVELPHASGVGQGDRRAEG